MFKFLFFLILLVLTITIVLYAFSRLFLHMPSAFQFKSKKKGGMLSPKWMDWVEGAKPFGPIVYEYVVPRNTRQERYARSHEVHFCAVINDKFYDTDIADGFWIQYTKLLGTDPCAKHYYRTQNGEFFSITATLGKKDQFSTVPEKEMKRLLKDEPTLYAAYIPHASENKDLREYTVRKKKEEEAKKKETAEQGATDVTKEEKTVKEKKERKLHINSPFKTLVKAVKGKAEQIDSVDDKEEIVDKDQAQTALPTVFTDSSKGESTKTIVSEEKTTASSEQVESDSSQPTKNPVKKHKDDKPKTVIPENTTSENMFIDSIVDAYNESNEVNSGQQEASNNKKPQDSGRKNKKNVNKEKNGILKQDEKNNKNVQKTKEDDNTEQKEGRRNKSEDKKNDASAGNVSSDNVKEKPVEVKPKKQRQKRKGSQMTDLPNDIGYDNVATVEKQQELENAMFEEPIQEEDRIEDELKKEEEMKREEETQDKLKNLDKAAHNMDAMKYRTVSKEG